MIIKRKGWKFSNLGCLWTLHYGLGVQGKNGILECTWSLFHGTEKSQSSPPRTSRTVSCWKVEVGFRLKDQELHEFSALLFVLSLVKIFDTYLLFCFVFLSINTDCGISNQMYKFGIWRESFQNQQEQPNALITLKMRLQCSTCLERMSPEEDLGSTPCGHVFHMVCVLQWFENKKNCPQVMMS